MHSNSVIFIVGPTASGKTALAVELAKRLCTEILSADSRQIYREMSIGTAKPTVEEQAAVKHHCIDICNVPDYFSAGEFGLLARGIINHLRKQDKIPIVAGGSGLYVQAIIDGIFMGNYRDPMIRKQIQEAAQEKGWEALYEQLEQVDAQSASKIHPNDHQRISRALEVYRITRKPISEIQAQETVPASFMSKIWGLNWPRDILYRRIEKRVDLMIEAGLVEEVHHLLKQGYSLKNNSLDSVGYKEIIAFLRGEITKDAAVNLIKRNTRHFAKRQMTWFRKDPRIQWIEMEEDMDLQKLCEIILSDL